MATQTPRKYYEELEVKVERPETGDLSRNLQPFVDDVSSQFMAFNRNKRSIEGKVS